MKRIGLISDTHGLLRPEALAALASVDQIIHAGDIGNAEILEQLRLIAPVIAVRGNNDKADWARGIAEHEVLDVKGSLLYVLHDVKELDLDPAASGFAAVISGHSHKPAIAERDGVLFVNPGSAGPRRFKLPISVGFLELKRGRWAARIQELTIGAGRLM